ncbi:sensor histidine kinase [Spirosoma utsteinense]|uniref:histidine kinase n=1 Tax=Spirosoma utsteinense TaxID=2585773 RepID=A0ABR6W1W9_9BACT|nr:ATP-binding protein [Spirosoma utsteinense]MBC3785169.1 signal transduction histidine kinase [Spirosoma utsteinense]MBC3790606.1 signal transduction histidine kinase [Spirosoma utsteinense]
MESVRNGEGTVTDFRFTHINPAAEWITQQKKEALIGELYSNAWPEARQNGVLDWHLRVVQTRTPLKINGVNLPVGEYDGWYNIRIRPFGDGVIATFVDVTALKQAEFANQHQAELLRSVLDNSLNPIIAFSAIRDKTTGQIVDFRYEAQNEASRRDVDRTDEEVIGHTMLEYFPHVIETGLFDRYVRVIETGQSERFEQEYNYDKLTGWSEMTVSKWGDGIVLTLVSITDSRDRQQQLEQVNRELLNANENLRQFAHVASHDLQEPLRKITAFSDILQDQFSPLLGDHGKDIINRMRSATERMSTLIRDVLAYSRISTYREPFQLVALNQLLANVCYELKSNVQETGSKIDVSELPIVQGDRNQLYHLFINLLTNALKFQPGQQPALIEVTCQTVTGNDGPPELETDRDYYEISLTDNGIGFDSKYTELIFQVFQRLHSRQQYNGTGMGLAICKRVVENHRGAIMATSLPGQGATFRVYLPK